MKSAVLSLSIAIGLAACSHSGGVEPVQTSSQIKLYSLSCGHLKFTRLDPFARSGVLNGRPGEMPVPCFLIRHPKGDLLWDAGLPDAIAPGDGGQTVEGMTMTIPVTFAEQLEAIGIQAKDIDYFAPSHSHFDHVGNAYQLTASTLLIQKVEYDWMFSDGIESGVVIPDMVAPMREMETVYFEGEHDVFGDGSVTIIPTAGHTPGHSVLRVELENAGAYYLVGDLYHLAISREKRLVPLFNWSAEKTLESMEALEARVIEDNGTVVIEHDPPTWESLPKVPEYLD